MNNVQVFKFNEKWKDGRPWLSAEDGKMFCSYCREFDIKTSRNKLISGCDSMRIENVHSHDYVIGLSLDYGGMMLN